MCIVMSETEPEASSRSSASETSATSARKSIDRALGVVPRELARDGDELVEVLDARFVLRVAARAQRVGVAALAEQQLQPLGDGGRRRELAGGGEHELGRLGQHRVEVGDRRLDLGADAERRRVRERVAEGDLLVLRVPRDRLDRSRRRCRAAAC